MVQHLHPQPLTQHAFALFGDVIETCNNPLSINYGQTERFHDLANIDTSAHNGRTLVNIFRSTPLALPISIKIMERHPLSSQAFIPLSPHPYLVVVAPKGEFDESKIVAFLASPHQGVNYHAGTWHHYSLALDAVSDFLVIDRGDQGGETHANCDETELQKPLLINL
ncbi:MAG TPA: ureidoglycolate lyase [Hellea balneolensis]|uniref:Ureidoglycolate lyase n=1 Tax=Hellea balneolensis TaxID=287478 RepID=A0A7C3C110_9PROT|nr:ureidoglycolate lyase [Hellea balneolensis]